MHAQQRENIPVHLNIRKFVHGKLVPSISACEASQLQLEL